MANEAKQFTIGGVTHDVMDVGARQLIADLQTAINAITSGDTTTAIKTFQEVINFLDGVTDDATLIGKLNELRTLIAAKYSKPASGIPASDLADGVIPDVSGFATKTEVNAKANSADVYNKSEVDTKVAEAGKVKTVSVNNGTPAQPDSNGNVNIQVQTGSTISPADTAPQMDGNTALVGSSAKYAREDHVHPHDTSKLSKSDVSVETQGDGTVDINVKDDKYTINLNHTHEGMAKLVVDTAANLPDASEMESDTIYGELDDGEIATIYLGGYPFYGGGGGASSGPVLRRPADGATIDMGQTTSGTVSKTINVKGKSLTQALTIQLNGTGYSFGTTQPSGVTRDSATQLTVTAAAANALNGVDIVVVYTGNDTDEDASGTLGITSNDNISTEATLVANKRTYEDLAGVKLTGTQWLQTDYKPGPNTEFVISAKFTPNSNTQNPSAKGQYIFNCPNDGNYRWVLYNGAPANDGTSGAYVILLNNQQSVSGQLIDVAAQKSEFEHDPVSISYEKQSSKGVLTFDGGTPRSVDTVLKTTTMAQPMSIGYHFGASLVYNVFDLTIYSIIMTENGNEVRHWVPKKKDGVPGLYDTVNNTFISSATSTELVAVPLT